MSVIVRESELLIARADPGLFCGVRTPLPDHIRARKPESEWYTSCGRPAGFALVTLGEDGPGWACCGRHLAFIADEMLQPMNDPLLAYYGRHSSIMSRKECEAKRTTPVYGPPDEYGQPYELARECWECRGLVESITHANAKKAAAAIKRANKR